jgi:hypothetical protein
MDDEGLIEGRRVDIYTFRGDRGDGKSVSKYEEFTKVTWSAPEISRVLTTDCG